MGRVIHDYWTWVPERHLNGTNATRCHIVTVLAAARKECSPLSRLPLELLFCLFGWVWKAGGFTGVQVGDHFNNAGYGPACTSDHIFVPRLDERGVAVLTRAGKLVRHIGAGEMTGCCFVALSNNHAYVTQPYLNRVAVIRVSDGVLVRHIATGTRPTGIAAANGLLFVACATDNCVVFREDGTRVRTFGRRVPWGVAVDDELVVFADDANCVSMYRADNGDYLRSTEGCISTPYGVCVRGGLVFVADAGKDRVTVFSATDGTHVAVLGGTGVTTHAHGCCISDDGVLYVTCREGIVSFRCF